MAATLWGHDRRQECRCRSRATEASKSCTSESEQSVEQYLALLSADERMRLEQDALATAGGIAADGLRRAVAAGNESRAAGYRQAIVHRYVGALLDSVPVGAIVPAGS